MGHQPRLPTVREVVHNPLVVQQAGLIAACAILRREPGTVEHLVVLLAREVERLQALLDGRNRGDVLADMFSKSR